MTRKCTCEVLDELIEDLENADEHIDECAALPAVKIALKFARDHLQYQALIPRSVVDLFTVLVEEGTFEEPEHLQDEELAQLKQISRFFATLTRHWHLRREVLVAIERF